MELHRYSASPSLFWRAYANADIVVTPELFAQSLCDDFNVPLHIFGPKIVAAIHERTREYQDQVLPILQRHVEPCRGNLDPRSSDMAVFRQARECSEEVKTDSGHEDDDCVRIVGLDENEDMMDERPMTVEEATLCLPISLGEELRILIKVNSRM